MLDVEEDGETEFGDWGAEALDTPELTGNIYLDDPEQGLSLISKICCTKNTIDNTVLRRLDYLIDVKLLKSFLKIELTKELEYYRELKKITDCIEEYHGISYMETMTVVGIGGLFSAGKSAFINSLLGDGKFNRDFLTVGQLSTTSIPTYLVNGEEMDIKALTMTGDVISLQLEEMQALTHKFYEIYGFGFNKYVKKMIITIPELPFKNIALLDTPGYNKSDSTVSQNFEDEQKALVQLGASDYVIWTIDVENGTIKDTDLTFLQKVKPEKPILVVVNKADKKMSSYVTDTVNIVKERLEEKGIAYYDVIPYSSVHVEMFDKTPLLRFLTEAGAKKIQLNAGERFACVKANIENGANHLLSELINKHKSIGKQIRYSSNPNMIRSFVTIYRDILFEKNNLSAGIKKYEQTCSEIAKVFNKR